MASIKSRADAPGPNSRLTPRWWKTLAFRLALAVNLAVVVVLGAFEFVDYRREETVHIRQEVDRLREEAQVLRVAAKHFSGVEEFQRFVDQFCRQMSSAASPGHHIVVFDRTGRVVARAHERAKSSLEAKMASARQASSSQFDHDGDPFVSVNLKTDKDTIIAVAQSLAPTRQLLRAQRISRAVSMAILVVFIFGVTTVALLVWVRDPLRTLVASVTAVGHRRFDVRVRPTGSSELRFLARGFNEMAKSLERGERDRASEMRRAREIQQALLPRNGLKVNGFDMAAQFLPAESVGGDLYDVLQFRGGSTLVCVFDVCGHGVAAALCTALLRTVLHHQAAVTSDLKRIAGAMNKELTEIAPSGTFASCFLARLVSEPGRVEYVSAGHDPGIVVRMNGAQAALDDRGMVLGVRRRPHYRVSCHPLNPGDRLFLFTDGLHEVLDAQGRPFGRDRLRELLLRTGRLPPDEQLDTVIREVRSCQGVDRFDDDVTLLCIRCQ